MLLKQAERKLEAVAPHLELYNAVEESAEMKATSDQAPREFVNTATYGIAKSTCEELQSMRTIPGLDRIAQYLLFTKLMQREAEASTVIETGLATPHIVVEGQGTFAVLLVRSPQGIDFPNVDAPVHAVFGLAGSKDARNCHLRALMAIAQIVQETQFQQRWLEAKNKEAIRNLVLQSARRRDTD